MSASLRLSIPRGDALVRLTPKEENGAVDLPGAFLAAIPSWPDPEMGELEKIPRDADGHGPVAPRLLHGQVDDISAEFLGSPRLVVHGPVHATGDRIRAGAPFTGTPVGGYRHARAMLTDGRGIVRFIVPTVGG